MKINKRSKVGIIIHIVTLVTILFLVIFNRIVPSVLVWIFSAGTVISLSGPLIELSENKRRELRL